MEEEKQVKKKMKMKSDISSPHFHKCYAEKYGRLHQRERTSLDNYTAVLTVFFAFILNKLYEGVRFVTPIGNFQIRKIFLKPGKKRLKFGCSTLIQQTNYVPYKTYFHRLFYDATYIVEYRYKFVAIQSFTYAINKYFQ